MGLGGLSQLPPLEGVGSPAELPAQQTIAFEPSPDEAQPPDALAADVVPVPSEPDPQDSASVSPEFRELP